MHASRLQSPCRWPTCHQVCPAHRFKITSADKKKKKRTITRNENDDSHVERFFLSSMAPAVYYLERNAPLQHRQVAVFRNRGWQFGLWHWLSFVDDWRLLRRCRRQKGRLALVLFRRRGNGRALAHLQRLAGAPVHERPALSLVQRPHCSI